MAHHVRAHHEPSELESSSLENNGLRLSTPSGRPFTGLSLLKKPISRKRHDGSFIRSEGKPSGNKNVTARKRTSRQSHAQQNTSSIRRSLSENIFSEGPIDPASAFHILTSKDVSIESWSFLDFEKPEEDAPVPILDLQVLSKITSTEISADTVAVPQDQPESNEVLEQSMGFLAAVSEDATDAEMESLAKIEAQLFSPITAPSPPPMAVTMEETSPSN